MKIIILIVLVIFGLTAVACTGEVPSPADTQTASLPTPDVPATVEAGIRGTREAETAIDATVEAKVAATLTTSAPSPTPMLTATPRPTNTPGPTSTPGQTNTPRPTATPYRHCSTPTYTHAYTYAHSHTYTHAYTYARGSDDHPFGVGSSCARFMRRWNLRYPRAGHQLVGREPISLVEVRLRRNRLRAEPRGVGYEERRRASA